MYCTTLCSFSLIPLYLTKLNLFYIYRFQGRFLSIERDFKSPVGSFGAIYAICIFALVYLSSAFLQSDQYASLAIVLVYTGTVSIYYYFGPATTQVITDEEFRCNVINANYRRRHGDITYRICKYLGIHSYINIYRIIICNT